MATECTMMVRGAERLTAHIQQNWPKYSPLIFRDRKSTRHELYVQTSIYASHGSTRSLSHILDAWTRYRNERIFFECWLDLVCLKEISLCEALTVIRYSRELLVLIIFKKENNLGRNSRNRFLSVLPWLKRCQLAMPCPLSNFLGRRGRLKVERPWEKAWAVMHE